MEIPIIDLIGPIYSGTTEAIMDVYVGHFEETSTWDGNVGLIAHNRGFPVNYFRDLRTLNIGDEIIYRHGGRTRVFEVVLSTTIEETDWSYLEHTEDNRITLITCVEYRPHLRRVIQGLETHENRQSTSLNEFKKSSMYEHTISVF